ncbi:universal stress protein [Ulvibacter antarcticus]|uniref:Nucleotide-binding universal stress UspA family protein n=1 Tax=Ulvibacter antarcticus TaxID=442714 RepID=A0A3L9YKQ3_9FLAO|nr:universal stress protein [Ulvibacter antarcticus]RMA58705.1 nucleotide-binding universal stress UspA family protein [Ulvibacter antarcticus]
MKQILFPTDFSENSENAIRYALNFFKDIEAEFYFLHVSTEDQFENSALFVASELVIDQSVVSGASEKLEVLIKRIQNQFKNKKHKHHGIHESIQFIEAIRKNVNHKQIDCIVMGTKGASKLLDTALGSYTADVIKRVKCNILVIPENAKYCDPSNIVFPTDFNINYTDKVLNSLSDILKLKKVKINVLYISKKIRDLSVFQKKNRAHLQDYLEGKPHSFYFITNENIDDAVETYVRITKVDMIAMVAKNLNYFERILFHPTVEKISYHTKVPFLVLHE